MNMKKPPSELWLAMQSLRPYFRRAFGFSAVTTMLMLMPAWYMLEVYDRVVNARSYMTLAMVTVLVLGAYVLMEVLHGVRSGILRQGAMQFDEALSSRVFKVLFQANLRRFPGGTMQTMTDLRTVREFVHSPVVQAAMEAPVALSFLVLIYAINPLLGWVAAATAVLQVFVGWLNERSTQPKLMEANRTAIAAQQYADGALRNAQVVESMGMMKDIQARWMSKQQGFLDLQAEASLNAGGYQALSKLLQQLVSSTLLGLSAWLLLYNELRGGPAMLIISSILGGRVLAPLVQIVSQWRSVVNVRDAWARLEHVLANLPAQPDAMSLPPPKGALSVEAVTAVAPGSNAQILRQVSFAIRAGETLMVIGPSGCGKTTLARLLTGVWPPLAGKVRLDGVDVFGWDKAELGPHVGYLPQSVELFDGTFAENIARFGEVEPAKVRAAAQAVGLHELIAALPDGYDTQIGADGAMLSGGQRQRVALARALYGDPVFVVLDEPNSSLDEAGDAALAGAIAELKARGTTFVVVTHRASILQLADKLLLMRDGAVQAFGPRDEVLAALNKAAAAAQASAAPQPGPSSIAPALAQA